MEGMGANQWVQFWRHISRTTSANYIGIYAEFFQLIFS